MRLDGLGSFSRMPECVNIVIASGEYKMARLLFAQNLWMEQLGAMTLAAVARSRGHKVALAVGSDDQIVAIAREYKPDVVGFTALTGFQRRWLRVARSIKQSLERPPVIIFGGPHPTFFPEIIIEDGIDLACRGEGEGVIADLLDGLDAGAESFRDIPNIVTKSEGRFIASPMRPLVDLDSLPFADREISFAYPFIRKDPNVHFIAGRGCPYSCSFCFNRRMSELCRDLGPQVRFRSVANLIEEISEVNRRWGIKVVYFQDDTFVLNKKWLFEFLDAYGKKLRIPFYCTVRADLVTNEMAKALKDAGCYRVSFGVESGVEEIRRKVLNKNIADDRIRETAAALRDAGISFQTTNMMGLPGETLDDAFKTIELNVEIGADAAWTSLFQPYPGTDLGELSFAEKRIDRIPDDETIADAHTSSILKQPDIDEVVRLQKLVYLAVKIPFVLPLIRKILKYNYPRIYYYIHRITYLLFYFKRITLMSFRRMIDESIVAWKYYQS